MTYLDLLTELQSFSDDMLLQDALCWDEDCVAVVPVRRFCRLKDDPENNIHGEISGDLRYYIHI